ncbi:redox-sensitive transcriptional activator SoxR [Veronia nyctiphanis]|uniref:Redox-sensitive transcriptional activator SoxR n=1 Tax=Veronia nyctiphanis TaxID=1278244 RepID=A0A4Q0YZS8_9GAMM|nr:redox-sensitive transcriptional activator SoxR [Veronia nyctiphanis]RXJ74661.1 redox-sensitive transcriptional activator SoxR [Veronia nyctiphanis]
MELSVGQVAKRSGVAVSALHFYEKKGLIFSNRNAGNQRRYSNSVLRRVAVIKTAQQLGISLDEIKEVLATLPRERSPSREDWSEMAEIWRQDLQQRIARLQRLSESLDSCIGCGCLSLDKCGLRNPDDVMGKKDSGGVLLRALEE